jgi:hypothetical protein
MITIEHFTYTNEQWSAIKAIMQSALGLDADRIERERKHIELAVFLYLTRRSLGPAELKKLREDTKKLRARIEAAFDHSFTMHVTAPFFDVLWRNIDTKLERGSNAKKPDRDQFWAMLLAIWCNLGGKPHGAAAAKFLTEASNPPVSNDVPNLAAVVLWLNRRRD